MLRQFVNTLKIISIIKKNIKSLLNLLCFICYKRKIISDNKKNANKILILFPSPSVPWSYMFQRPQQLAKFFARAGKTKDVVVYYGVQNNFKFTPDKTVKGTFFLEDNLFLYNDYSNGKLLETFNKIVIWRYWATQKEYLSNIQKNVQVINVYDVVDDVAVYDYNKKQLSDHAYLEKKSEIVVTSSKRLKKLSKREDIFLMPNACDYDFFANPNDNDINLLDKNLQEKIKGNKVKVCYYGAIADWFDTDLLVECAKSYPDWEFIIIGRLYDNIGFIDKIFDYKNIVHFDAIDYNLLPIILSKINIAIIPFKINDITKSTSPVKLFEYLAAGKPTVTTQLYEITDIKTVFISSTYEEFISNLSKAEIKSKDSDFIKEMKNIAKNNSWEKRIEDFFDFLEEKLAE